MVVLQLQNAVLEMAEADEDLPGVTSAASVPVKKKSYDAAFKLSAVQYAAKHSNREAGRKFGVGESSVRDWKKQQDKFQTCPLIRNDVYQVEAENHLTKIWKPG